MYKTHVHGLQGLKLSFPLLFILLLVIVLALATQVENLKE